VHFFSFHLIKKILVNRETGLKNIWAGVIKKEKKLEHDATDSVNWRAESTLERQSLRSKDRRRFSNLPKAASTNCGAMLFNIKL